METNQKMKVLFSLNSVKSMGRCYHKTQRASIFLNQIFAHSYNTKIFTLNFLDTIHHEILHLVMKKWKIKGCYSEKKVDRLARELSNLCYENLLSLKEVFSKTLFQPWEESIPDLYSRSKLLETKTK